MVVNLRNGGLVFLNQILDSYEVPAPVAGSNDGLLFPDPGFLVLDVPVELLDGERIHQTLLPLGHRLHEVGVPVSQGALLGLDVFRVKVSSLMMI
jgi:hypothetical protein